MKSIEKRLILFSAIEPGDQFWSEEISRWGIDDLYDRIKGERFYLKAKSIKRILRMINENNPSKLLEEINSVNGEFISPEDSDWPNQLDDLIAPPIGLVIQGRREVLALLGNSLAIVGTRNPTTYGARVAGELAVGDIVTGKQIGRAHV